MTRLAPRKTPVTLPMAPMTPQTTPLTPTGVGTDGGRAPTRHPPSTRRRWRIRSPSGLVGGGTSTEWSSNNSNNKGCVQTKKREPPGGLVGNVLEWEKKNKQHRPPLHRLGCSHAMAKQPTARRNRNKIKRKDTYARACTAAAAYTKKHHPERGPPQRPTTNGSAAGVREPLHTLHDTNTGGSRQLKKGDKPNKPAHNRHTTKHNCIPVTTCRSSQTVEVECTWQVGDWDHSPRAASRKEIHTGRKGREGRPPPRGNAAEHHGRRRSGHNPAPATSSSNQQQQPAIATHDTKIATISNPNAAAVQGPTQQRVRIHHHRRAEGRGPPSSPPRAPPSAQK